MRMIPERLIAYASMVPSLHEATQWTLLRQWALSEVYRITLASGETRIVKWGASEMAGEAAIYEQLLQPLEVPIPEIYGFYQQQQHNSAVIVMEDCGAHNLEQRPRPGLFLEAARVLARIRNTAARHIPTHLPNETIHSYSVTSANFCSLLEDLLRSKPCFENQALASLQAALPVELHQLEELLPLTLVHHDYHAKNLIAQEKQVLPIDWSNAYLSPHLGDLYCLMSEAAAYSNVPQADVLDAFRAESHLGLSRAQLEHQVLVGGICWLIKSLRWLVYGGTAIIPGSEEWVPDMLGDLENLAQQLN